MDLCVWGSMRQISHWNNSTKAALRVHPYSSTMFVWMHCRYKLNSTSILGFCLLGFFPLLLFSWITVLIFIPGPSPRPERPLPTTKHWFHTGNLIIAVISTLSSGGRAICFSSCICLGLANTAVFWPKEGELPLLFSYIFNRKPLRADLQTVRTAADLLV